MRQLEAYPCPRKKALAQVVRDPATNHVHHFCTNADAVSRFPPLEMMRSTAFGILLSLVLCFLVADWRVHCWLNSATSQLDHQLVLEGADLRRPTMLLPGLHGREIRAIASLRLLGDAGTLVATAAENGVLTISFRTLFSWTRSSFLRRSCPTEPRISLNDLASLQQSLRTTASRLCTATGTFRAPTSRSRGHRPQIQATRTCSLPAVLEQLSALSASTSSDPMVRYRSSGCCLVETSSRTKARRCAR